MDAILRRADGLRPNRLPRLSAGCVSPPGPRVEPTPAAIAAALRTPAILALYGSSLLTAATIAIYLAVN